MNVENRYYDVEEPKFSIKEGDLVDIDGYPYFIAVADYHLPTDEKLYAAVGLIGGNRFTDPQTIEALKLDLMAAKATVMRGAKLIIEKEDV